MLLDLKVGVTLLPRYDNSLLQQDQNFAIFRFRSNADYETFFSSTGIVVVFLLIANRFF